MSFAQGVPSVNTLINSSNTQVFGNTSTGTALSVQQLGTGSVMNVATSTGTSALFVNSSGQVGVGRTNPTSNLQVQGQTFSNTFQANGIYRTDLSTSGFAFVSTAPGSNFQLYNSSTDARLFNSGGPLVLNVLDSGVPSGTNVGIGRTDPSYGLDVYGATSAPGTIRALTASQSSGVAGAQLRLMEQTDSYGFALQNINALRLGLLYYNGGSGVECVSVRRDNGNVGIGVVNPPSKLAVAVAGDAEKMTTASWSDRYFCVGQNPTTTSNCVSIGFDNSGTGGWIYSLAPSVAWRQLNYGALSHAFYCSSSTSAMVINSSSNVGIGLASPSSQLHVYGAGQNTNGYLNTAGALGGSLILQDSGASIYNGGAILFGATQGLFASIKGVATNGTSNTVGDLAISTRNGTTDATLTPRIYINNGGNVSLGGTAAAAKLSVVVGGGATAAGPVWDANWFTVTTNDNNNQNAVGIGYNTASNYGVLSCVQPSVGWRNMVYSAALHDFFLNSTFAFSIRNSMTGGATTISVDASGYLQRGAVSDQRLKSNIVTMTDYGLKTITDLRPVSYEATPESVGRIGEGVHYGLVAQEVQTVFPYAVSADQDEQKTLTIDYIKLVPVLINSIKELSAQVAALEQSLSSAVATQASLQAQVTALQGKSP